LISGGAVGTEGLRQRLKELERREVLGLLLVGFLLAGGAAFWFVRTLPSAVRIQALGGGGGGAGGLSSSGAGGGGSGGGYGSSGPPGGPSPPGATPTPSQVVVDVAGWVRKPGVYSFSQGERAVDAIRKAGGARTGADLTSINLAALLSDGEQIIVGKAGSGTPVSSTSTGSSGVGGGSGAPGPGSPVNLNTATLEQLESLPGIGPAFAQRILDYRTQHGSFRTVDDLLNVSGIGDKRLADLKPDVTV